MSYAGTHERSSIMPVARLRSLPRALQVGGVVVLLAILAGASVLAFSRPSGPAQSQAAVVGTPTASPSVTSAAPTETPTTEPSVIAARCPLNGVPIARLPAPGVPALIVQIENHPAARPARNLTNADIVIEATVEGDVTRFSAIFYCQPTLGLSGPIRSARYYSVDLWQELHALTVAFGESNGATARFLAAGLPEVNGIRRNWPFFQRYGTAAAPHNLYGDLEAVRRAALSDASVRPLASAAGTLRPPFRIDPAAAVPAGAALSKVTIKTNGYWTFAWTWDPALQAFRRSDAGTPIVDAATGRPVIATSVVVQRITESVVQGDPDPGGNPRRDLHLVGRGSGTLFVDGKAITVNWSRPSASAATTWTYADGSPMVLPAGPIWWELVPSFGTVVSS